jgi:hypothetical protein
VHFGTRNDAAYVTTQINYNYAGVETGNDPFGVQHLNVGLLKHTRIITAAVNTLNEGGANLPLSLIAELPDNITIESVIFQDEQGTVLAPSSHNVRLDNIKSLGISHATAIKLLDEIINQHTIDFQDMYKIEHRFGSLFSEMFAKNAIEIRSPGHDYIMLYDMLVHDLETSTNQARTAVLDANAGSFQAQGSNRTLNSMLSQLEIVKLEHIGFFILLNGVTVFDEDELEFRRLALTAELTRAEDLHDGYTEIMKNFTSGGVVPGSGDGTVGFTIPPELSSAYREVVANVDFWLREIDRINTDISNIVSLQEGTTNTDKTKAEAEALLTGSATQISTLLRNIENTLEEFSNAGIAGAVRQIRPTTLARPTSSASKIALAAFVLVVLLAGVAAVAVTYFTAKKSEGQKTGD